MNNNRFIICRRLNGKVVYLSACLVRLNSFAFDWTEDKSKAIKYPIQHATAIIQNLFVFSAFLSYKPEYTLIYE